MIFILIISFIPPFTESKTSPINSDWVKTYGTGITTHMRQTSDGGFIIAGIKNDGSYLIKTDSCGTQQWEKTWDPLYGFNDVQQTSDGGYIICGSWSGNEGLLMKTTPDGTASWENHYWVMDMGYYFELKSVQQTSDGGFISGGLRAKPPQEIAEGFVVKTNAYGEDEWIQVESESINCIIQTPDGGYISTGIIDVWPPEDDQIYHVGLCKRNSAGNIQWDEKISQMGSASSVLSINGCGYMIVCNEFANIAKSDNLGNIQWQKTYNNASINAIDKTSDGGFILAGVKEGSGYILKINENGIKQWDKIFKDNNYQTIQSVFGGYIISGINNGQITLTKLSIREH